MKIESIYLRSNLNQHIPHLILFGLGFKATQRAKNEGYADWDQKVDKKMFALKVQLCQKGFVIPANQTKSLLLNFSFEIPALFYETKYQTKMSGSSDLVW